jgi:hypothetical protein
MPCAERFAAPYQPITFRPGSTEITEEFQDELRDAVPKLRHYPTYRAADNNGIRCGWGASISSSGLSGNLALGRRPASRS